MHRGAMGRRQPTAANREAVLGHVVEDDLDRIVQRASTALDQLAGTTVLVTGASGFLLSYVVDALARSNDELLTRPCRVIAIDNAITGESARLAHLAGRADV